MKKIQLVLVAIATVGSLVYILIPSGEDAAQQLDRAAARQAKQSISIETSSESTSLELSAENTKVGFSCAKNLAGKTVTVQGGWNKSFGSQLKGRALLNPETEDVLQIELQIEIATLWSEHDMLTDALLTKGFFQVEENPQAAFVSTSIKAGVSEGSAQEDATHQIEGNFSLNGIKRSISFPAKIELTPSGLQVHSKFSLLRKDFDVHFTDTAGFGLLTDENISGLIAMAVTINVDRTSQVLVNDDDNGSSRDMGGGAAGDQPVDVSSLPPNYTETIPATQIPFEMVLVPGDDESGIQPLYVGKFEVTWDEFMPWVDGRDLENIDSLGELRAMKLRPSPPYGSVDRGFGMDRRPALGMSRLSAELYCQWLSEQTGKTYRLPTEKEWEYVYQLGGGNLDDPPTAGEAERLAVYSDNSFDDDIDDWATKQVGATEPDSLSIHDLAGNVCEWVVETSEERIARGGHFDSDREELGVGRHVENPDWNRDYPNEPKSIWWFVNAPWVGFRVVAELPSR